MSFPASLTTRTVKGRFVTYPSGAGARGTVRIILSDYMQGPTDDAFVVPFDTTITLDPNGEFTIDLPATDDPQWTSASYQVIVNISGKHLRTTLLVPYQGTGPIDLVDVINVPPPTPGQSASYVLLASKGAPNGVASLGSDGKVPAGQLPSGSGGSSAWADITGKPSTFPPSTHTHNDLAKAFTWDGSTYIPASGAGMYVGPVDPETVLGSIPNGSAWFNTTSGTITPQEEEEDVYPLSAYGLVGATGAPEIFRTNSPLSSGDVFLGRIYVPANKPITGLYVAVRTAGVHDGATTGNRLGVYDDSGAQIGLTAVDNTLFTAAGWRGGAIVGGPIAAQSSGRFVYVAAMPRGMSTSPAIAYLVNASTDGPDFQSGPAGGNRRSMYQNGLTALPASFNPTSYGTASTFLPLYGIS